METPSERKKAYNREYMKKLREKIQRQMVDYFSLIKCLETLKDFYVFVRTSGDEKEMAMVPFENLNDFLNAPLVKKMGVDIMRCYRIKEQTPQDLLVASGEVFAKSA